jgi:hypothetical protein
MPSASIERASAAASKRLMDAIREPQRQQKLPDPMTVHLLGPSASS